MNINTNEQRRGLPQPLKITYYKKIYQSMKMRKRMSMFDEYTKIALAVDACKRGIDGRKKLQNDIHSKSAGISP
jgi:hypothetical protein